MLADLGRSLAVKPEVQKEVHVREENGSLASPAGPTLCPPHQGSVFRERLQAGMRRFRRARSAD